MNIKYIHEVVDALEMKSVDCALIGLASRKGLSVTAEGEGPMISAMLASAMMVDDKIRDIVMRAYELYCGAMNGEYDMDEKGGEE